MEQTPRQFLARYSSSFFHYPAKNAKGQAREGIFSVEHFALQLAHLFAYSATGLAGLISAQKKSKLYR